MPRASWLPNVSRGAENHKRNLQRTAQTRVARTLPERPSSIASRCDVGANVRPEQSLGGTAAHSLPGFLRFSKPLRKAAAERHLVWQWQVLQRMLSEASDLLTQHGQHSADATSEAHTVATQHGQSSADAMSGEPLTGSASEAVHAPPSPCVGVSPAQQGQWHVLATTV